MGIELDFPAVLERWPNFLSGAVLTLELALFATVLGALLGTFAAVGRGTHKALIARACKVYVEAIRNTPLLVQIFLVYFGLASIGLKLSAFTVAVAALTINVGAYTPRSCAPARGDPRATDRGRRASRCRAFRLRHIILCPRRAGLSCLTTSSCCYAWLPRLLADLAEEFDGGGQLHQSDTYRAFRPTSSLRSLHILSW